MFGICIGVIVVIGSKMVFGWIVKLINEFKKGMMFFEREVFNFVYVICFIMVVMIIVVVVIWYEFVWFVYLMVY